MKRFLADRMLGTLAKWLRILGFDTLYPGELSDAELIEIAETESRIILTRDKEIFKRSSQAVLIESDVLDGQIKQVISRYPVQEDAILTRCIICNETVSVVKKEELSGQIPDAVLERQSKFWKCNECQRIYWSASHWDNMLEKVQDFLV